MEKNMKYVILTVLLFSCGIELRQKEPVEVNVNHKLDLYQVEQYFKTVCEEEHPNFNDAEIYECVDEYMAKFIQSIGDAL